MSIEPEQNSDDRSSSDTPIREKWAFEFSVTGDLRFISHRDTVRVFQRALARAALPVAYSEGFNPHPRLSLPLPRAVGVASEAELMDVIAPYRSMIREFDEEGHVTNGPSPRHPDG